MILGHCPSRYGCRGVAYAATGSIDARDPHCFFDDADSLREVDKVVSTMISER
ncbi:MAG: hypothetical protein GF411_13015 [Candidatus Lokiarchaeota archaeon]|nr:hypothetical protein [Candidatus Lokiarchaeota archaeon]